MNPYSVLMSVVQEVGQRVRAARKEEDIPLNPFTAGVYIATMMATVQVLRERSTSCLSQKLPNQATAQQCTPDSW